MRSTLEVWNELVAEARKAAKFADVRAYPFHRINDEKFLKDFPDLKMPACLIVYLGGSDASHGQALDRDVRWSAVIVDKDEKGDAYEVVVAAIDALRRGPTRLLDRRILDDDVIVNGTSETAVIYTNPRFAVQELGFSTREAGERDDA